MPAVQSSEWSVLLTRLLDAPSQQMNREVRSPDLSDARGGDRGVCERHVKAGLCAERSLDSEHENVGQPGCDKLPAQLLRVVVVGHQVEGVPFDVLAVRQDAEKVATNGRIAQLTPGRLHGGLGPAGHRRNHNGRARRGAADSLCQCEGAVGSRRQVVERAEHQDRVSRLVAVGQSPRVTLRRLDATSASLPYVLGHRIQQLDGVATLSEPRRVPARTASNVQHPRGRGCWTLEAVRAGTRRGSLSVATPSNCWTRCPSTYVKLALVGSRRLRVTRGSCPTATRRLTRS